MWYYTILLDLHFVIYYNTVPLIAKINFCLTLYHTIPTHGKKPFEKIMRKGENAGDQHFLLFPQCFCTSLEEFMF